MVGHKLMKQKKPGLKFKNKGEKEKEKREETKTVLPLEVPSQAPLFFFPLIAREKILLILPKDKP